MNLKDAKLEGRNYYWEKGIGRIHNPVRLLQRYSEGDVWFTACLEEGTLLEGFAQMCFTKMETLPLKMVLGPKLDHPGLDSYDYAYCHWVVGHAFMEFIHLSDLSTIFRLDDPGLRKVFNWFCKVNAVIPEYIEASWQEYIED